MDRCVNTLLVLVHLQIVEHDIRDAVRVDAGRAVHVADAIDLFNHPRRRLRLIAFPDLTLHVRRSVRAILDAQLHAVPRVDVPGDLVDAHGHLFDGLPWMNLEVLAVAEKHERVPLIDEADIATLPAHFGAAYVGLDRVVGPVGASHEEARTAADGVIARADDHAAAVYRVRNALEIGGPPHRRSLEALEVECPRQRWNDTDARLTGDVPDGGLDEPSRSRCRRHKHTVSADRAAEKIERPLRLRGRSVSYEVALGVVQPEREGLFRARIQQRFVREHLDLRDWRRGRRGGRRRR